MSTALAPVVDQHAALIGQIATVLQQHPLGKAFTLLYTREGLPLAQDEVLVQRVDAERRVIELCPTALADVDLDGVLHETQTITPQDGALTGYALNRVSIDCKATFHDFGVKGHVYVL
ncbi:hypothetical protein [Streptomyces sp. NPDC006285]|uniref:hypothetical protein n=1 Tax=Streptomyces sp. NPDC006285 TaxID=3364742 RepID=UPI00369EC6DA